jgi:hypothetical protein
MTTFFQKNEYVKNEKIFVLRVWVRGECDDERGKTGVSPTHPMINIYRRIYAHKISAVYLLQRLQTREMVRAVVTDIWLFPCR